MEIYTREQLYAMGLNVINAMILEGPENEHLLHLLNGLFDPDPELDNFATIMKEATEYVNSQYGKLETIIADAQ